MKYTEAILGGVAGALIAAATTYWSIVDNARNDAILKTALVNAKADYLNDIRESIALIAKAEANAENSMLNSQKQITRLATIEEQASKILGTLMVKEKNATQSATLDKDQLIELKRSLVIEISSIQMPIGTVVAFSTNECPDGWSNYAPAYGRFIRGIDKEGRTDPAGIRLPETLQSDSLKGHSHDGVITTSIGNSGQENQSFIDVGDGNIGKSTFNATGNNTKSSTKSFGDSETRPKNVALLYCEKI
jgi:hypothetical protein